MGSDWPLRFAVFTSEQLSSVVGTLVFFFGFFFRVSSLIHRVSFSSVYRLHATPERHASLSRRRSRSRFMNMTPEHTKSVQTRAHTLCSCGDMNYYMPCYCCSLFLARRLSIQQSSFSFNSLHRLLLIIMGLKMAF